METDSGSDSRRPVKVGRRIPYQTSLDLLNSQVRHSMETIRAGLGQDPGAAQHEWTNSRDAAKE